MSLRFDCPSASLNLATLSKRVRKALWPSLVLAVIMHLSFTRLVGTLRSERTVAKPLTTQFVKRQPRLTKPLEMKRRPRPKRRRLQRKMVAVRAKVSGQEISSSIRSVQVLGSLARPHVQMGRSVGFSAEVLEPQAVAQMIEGTKESRYTLDMALEMVDVDALDTGRYQAMVIQDPSDKRNIKGYLHLAIVYPLSVTERERYKGEGRLIEGLQRLMAKLNEWTDIKASVSRRVTLDSPDFFKTPWVYLRMGYELEPTQGEVENMGAYLLHGGFFFFEGNRLGGQQGERHLMRFVTSALESQGYRRGVDWEFEFLPTTHPVFHCYYDFPDGVPIGQTTLRKSIFGQTRDDDVEPWSRGVEIVGRLVAFSTNQALGGAWCGWGRTNEIYAGDAYAKYDPTLQFRFGINTIIFALTQEGSITKRVMDTVK